MTKKKKVSIIIITLLTFLLTSFAPVEYISNHTSSQTYAQYRGEPKDVDKQYIREYILENAINLSLSMILRLMIPFLPAKVFKSMWNMINDNTAQYNNYRDHFPDWDNPWEDTARWNDGQEREYFEL